MNNTIKTVVALSMAVWGTAAAQPRLSAPTRVAIATESEKETEVAVYINVDAGRLDREALDGLGVKVSLDLGDILTARVPANAVGALADVDGVEYVQICTPVNQMLDIARAEMGMEGVHTGKNLPQPYTGKGVVVGIVDSGFDYAHTAFRDADGKLRIKKVWEQSATATATRPAPEKYGYGAQLLTADDIIAAGGDINNNSHGTHVTSIAAGSDYNFGGALAGMAPDADIVLVSMLQAGGGNVCISDAIAYIFEYAESVGKPCVVNLSLGNQKGPHDGTSTFDVIADRLQGPGRLIVGSAGNSRAGSFHVSRRCKAGDEPLRTFIDFKNGINQKNAAGDVDVWAAKGMDVKVSLLVCKTTTGEVAERVEIYPGTGDDVGTISLGRNVSGTFSAAAETSALNGKVHVALQSAITNIRSGYAVAIEVEALGEGVVDIWADDLNLGLTSRGVDGYTGPTDESTICEIGGTANRILTVGAYTTRSTYVLDGESEQRKLEETDGDLASFSSCGPTADGRMKPQVAAPGCFISAAVSRNDHSGTQMVSRHVEEGDIYHLYGYMQGTSMASPFVTGTVAVWLEANPDLTPEDLVSVVKASARTDGFTGALTDGSNMWGYGKIDALEGVKQCLSMAGTGVITADNDEAARIIANADGSITVLFTADAPQAQVCCHNTAGQCVASAARNGVRAGDTITIYPGITGVGIVRVSTPTSTTVAKQLF